MAFSADFLWFGLLQVLFLLDSKAVRMSPVSIFFLSFAHLFFCTLWIVLSRVGVFLLFMSFVLLKIMFFRIQRKKTCFCFSFCFLFVVD